MLLHLRNESMFWAKMDGGNAKKKEIHSVDKLFGNEQKNEIRWTMGLAE